MSKKRKVPTLDSLKQEGFQVFLKHHKRSDGGRTTKAAIYDPKASTLFFAEARVSPGRNFSRAIGRAIAIGRACHERSRNKLSNITSEELKQAVQTVVFTPDVIDSEF